MAKRSHSSSVCTTISRSSSPPLASKQVSLEASDSTPTMITCTLAPHPPLPFTTLSSYDLHYLSSHTNRCQTCLSNLPTPHLLALHISENHDPFVAIRRTQGEKTYGCPVEGCERFCSTAAKRRRHCLDKHGYPKVANHSTRVIEST